MTNGARWWIVAGALAALAMLLMFDRVVRQVVQQGVARRAVEAQRADAVWRCNLLQGKQMRANCRLQ
jgi:hypothetical protein